MNVTALVFGSLGTLTETSALHRQAFNETFAEEGLDWYWDEPTYRNLLDHVGGVNRIQTYAAGRADQAPIDATWAAALHARKTERYAKLVRSTELSLRPGVERLLREAEAAGIKRGLATGTSLDNIEASLDAVGNLISLTDFDAYTTRDVIEHAKPSPAAHRRCVGLLAVESDGVLAIEDSADGVASAADAGLAVVATPGRFVSDQSFDRADLVMSDLGAPGHPARRLDVGAGPDGGIATLSWLAEAVRT
ncbi:MAG: HAD family hydrolase [Acidobacteriota bacterium]